MRLLNPGPVNLTQGVRSALTGPDLCHRELEYTQLQDRLRQQCLDVYQLASDQWQTILLTGSGTSAVEAMLCAQVPAKGRLLILDNGVYGQRMAQIASYQGIAHQSLAQDWLVAPDLAAIEACLVRDPGITHLAVVHHETTTGRLNPLAEIAYLCQGRNIHLLVDAVSSFGAEAIPFDSPALIGCAISANKCLHGIPGLSMVLARPDTLCESRGALTLDLRAQLRAQQQHETLYTPATVAMQALGQALTELAEQGGWRARNRHYRQLGRQLQQGLEPLGVAPLLPDQHCSVVLRSYRLPHGLDYDTLHDALKRDGFVIYAGQGPLRRQAFRLATMGALSQADIAELLAAMDRLLVRCSQPL